jgi:SAM-dependent methyltransferase
MSTVHEHYENLLSSHYTWLFGGLDAKLAENAAFFATHNLAPRGSRTALDLGCGSGFQSIPLARMGYQVTAIDSSEKLLAELKTNSVGLSVKCVQDNLLNFAAHCPGPIELCVCMGDTLTHLASKDDIQKLFRATYAALEKNGRLAITFRDLSYELKDLDRFIPVRSDERKIFTCFLEYEAEHVKVHDLLYEKNGPAWKLHKSFYRKCRMSFDGAKTILIESGFQLEVATVEKGLVTIIAVKQ